MQPEASRPRPRGQGEPEGRDRPLTSADGRLTEQGNF